VLEASTLPIGYRADSSRDGAAAALTDAPEGGVVPAAMAPQPHSKAARPKHSVIR